jgi:phytoene synthase
LPAIVPLPALSDPERALALAYAPAAARPALALLWALDEQLGAIVASTTQPAVGQMRLTWWHDALAGLRAGPPPAEPLLRALAGEDRLDPLALLPLIDGWEALLDPLPLAGESVALHGEARGGTLFAAAAALLGAAEDAALRRARDAGRLWALADLVHRVSDRETAIRARAAAAPLIGAQAGAWPRRLRPLGLLACLARRDLALPPGRPRRQGAPGRLLRALAFAVTGR